jgi:class 3 adenylate cyclase/TolB-like protein
MGVMARRTSQDGKPSIAVVPFTARIEDAPVRDSITETVTVALSAVSFFDVVIQPATERFSASPPDIDAIRDALGVSHVLHGTVQIRGDQLRVTAHFTDASTERNVWSGTFTESMGSGFDAEDAIAAGVSLAVEERLVGGTEHRRPRDESPAAYNEYARGMEAYLLFGRDTNMEARRLGLAALQHDPDFAQAHALVAWTYTSEYQFHWSHERDEALVAAVHHAAEALEIDPTSAPGLAVRSNTYLLSGDQDMAIATARRALELHPTSLEALHSQAMNMTVAGRFEEAVSLERRAIAVSPLDRLFLGNSRAILATAEVQLGRYEEALATADICLLQNPGWLTARVSRTVALVGLGRIDEARDEARRVLRIYPRFSTDSWESINPYADPRHHVPITDALIGVGLPRRAGESDLEPAPLSSEFEGASDGRWVATLLITDIVGSTDLASELGDEVWNDTLSKHDHVGASIVDAHAGRVIKYTGDGLLAMFDQPSDALSCSIEFRDRIASAGLQVRSGVHTGEIEVVDADVHGIGVHITARVSDLAAAGEILATPTVRQLVSGSGFLFTARGAHELRGVQGEWDLYAVEQPLSAEPIAP